MGWNLGAAWIRSSTGEIVLLDAPATGGTNVISRSVSNAAGNPMVLPALDGWVALWQSRDGRIWAMGWNSHETSDPTVLGSGWLVDAVVLGDDAIIAVLESNSPDSATAELAGLTLALDRALPIPVPTKTFQAIVTLSGDALPAICLTADARGGTLAWDAGQSLWGLVSIGVGGTFESPSYSRLPGRSKPTCEAVQRLAR